MKIKYLGTGAAEGIPAVFCHCDICNHARKYKNRNIRTRSQALIDDKILIDFGPDTYLHSLKYDINLSNIYHCLITHSHNDHLYVEDILARRRSRANLLKGTLPLTIYGGKGVERILNPKEDGSITKDSSVFFSKMRPFEKILVDNEYSITALPANHKTEEPFVYIIEHKDKVFLYGHDTDYFSEEVWDYLKRNKIYFSAISLDCTEGKKVIEYPGHMNFMRMEYMQKKMLEDKLIDKNTKIIANHISHNGLITYDEGVKIANNLGYILSYDGMEVNI